MDSDGEGGGRRLVSDDGSVTLKHASTCRNSRGVAVVFTPAAGQKFTYSKNDVDTVFM